MNWKWRNTLLWTLGYSIPVLLGAGLYMSKLVKKELIRSLNESLLVRVHVGEIRYTGLESFPFVGISLRNVRIQESFPAYRNDLLSAGTIELRVRPLKLLRGQLDITKLEIAQATVRIYQGAGGNANYEIFRKSDEPDRQFNLDFRNVLFRNCRFMYLDEQDLVSFNTMVHLLQARAKLVEDKMELKLSFRALFDHVRSGEEKFLIGKHIHWDSEIEWNRKIKACHIASASFGLEDLELEVKGDVLMVGQVPDLDLSFQSDQLQFQGLLALLPNKMASRAGDWQTEGQLRLSGHIRGSLQPDRLPDYEAKLRIAGGKLTGPPGTFKNIALEGAIRYAAATDQIRAGFDIKSLQFGQSELSAKCQSSDLEKSLDIKAAEITLGLKDLAAFYPDAAGYADHGLAKISAAGRLHFDNSLNPQLSGSFSLENVQARFPGMDEPIQVSSSGSFTPQSASIGNTTIRIGDDLMYLQGTIDRFSGFWTGERPVWQGTLHCPSLHVSHLIHPDAEPTRANKIANLDAGMDFSMQIDLGTIYWEDVVLRDVRSSLVGNAGEIRIESLNMNAWGGKHQAALFCTVRDGNYQIAARGQTREMRVKQLFREFRDFDQTEISHRHIDGQVTARYEISLLFNPDFEWISRELNGFGDVRISNGRLSGYKALEQLSLFLELDDLKDIAFEDMYNQIEIRNGILFLPETELKNSALNLSVSGSHSLENEMDYHLKVKVTDVLAKHSKWIEKKNAKRLEEGRDGGLTAYVKMSGTPETLKISYDTRSAVNSFRKDFKTERRSFFKEVGDEFKGAEPKSEDRKKPQWIE